MSDEHADVFADLYYTEDPDYIARALADWNRRQPTTTPMLEWSRLSTEQKLEVALAAVKLREKDEERDEELTEFADRVSGIVGLRLSTEQAAAIRGRRC